MNSRKRATRIKNVVQKGKIYTYQFILEHRPGISYQVITRVCIFGCVKQEYYIAFFQSLREISYTHASDRYTPVSDSLLTKQSSDSCESQKLIIYDCTEIV